MYRTLLVFSPLYPPHVGGLENHAAQFNEQLSKQGYRIIVFTPRTQAGGSSLEEPQPNLTIIRFPAWEIIPNYHVPAFWRPHFWRQLKKANEASETNKANAAITVSRTRFFATTALAGCYARWHRLPWLHIEHGSDYVQLNNPVTSSLARFYDKTIGRFVLTGANAVVANSRASAAFVRKLSSRDATVIYRGVDREVIDAIKPADLSKYLPPNRQNVPVIAYLGRLIDGKGVTDLIKAVNQIPNSKFQILIVGDGPQRVVLEQQVKNHGLAEQVTFLGEQSFEQSIAILKASTIAINPSYTEGLPTSVIEAALSKCVIVATDVGGTSEIVTHNRSALLVPPRQPRQLADAIERLLGDLELRQRLSDTARQTVEQKFSWSTAVPAYRQVIEQLSLEP